MVGLAPRFDASGAKHTEREGRLPSSVMRAGGRYDTEFRVPPASSARCGGVVHLTRYIWAYVAYYRYYLNPAQGVLKKEN